MNLRNVILLGDVREKLRDLPDESVHCVVTSPPYWAMRDYGEAGQLGLEPTMACYLEAMTDVFREVRRVLRRDGTLWLNMGDGYVAHAGERSGSHGLKLGPKHEQGLATRMPKRALDRASNGGLKPKDLNGTAWRLAFALQDDGWWLRRPIVWHKPNPIPESATDRPTASHEYVFLMSKAPRYFYDREAVREKGTSGTSGTSDLRKMAESRDRIGGLTKVQTDAHLKASALTNIGRKRAVGQAGSRNMRDVWTIATQSYRFKHFAAFPVKLASRCIRAGTSEAGCCSSCGAPWARQTRTEDPAGRLGKGYHDHTGDLSRGQRGIPDGGVQAPYQVTTGWEPACDHDAPVLPCVVFDPFMGAGTSAVAALQLGRDYLGIEINADYMAIAEDRISHQPRRML